jgi:hypothetical protein
MQLFIDANVFLSFYRFSSDDLEQLEKLTVLVKTGRIRLWLPEQVVDEFYRNREETIAVAIAGLKRHNFNVEFPRLAMEYKEYAQLRDLHLKYEKMHSALIKLISDDAGGARLKADSTVRSLFDVATQIPTTKELFSKASARSAVGNPPGKKGSIGDAINWEAVLEKADKSEDLDFVSSDTDYVSPLNDTELDGFLVHEWAFRKESQICLFRTLSQYLKARFPDIQLTTESELERVLALKDLIESRSFAQTHKAIQGLQTFKYFSPTELNQIAEAAVENDQIERIISDRDVFDFLVQLTHGREDEIEEPTRSSLFALLSDADAELNPHPPQAS